MEVGWRPAKKFYGSDCNGTTKGLFARDHYGWAIMTEEDGRERRRRNLLLGGILVAAVIIMYAGIFFKMASS